VATRYRPDAVGHRDDGEAECKRNAEDIDRCRAAAHAGNDRRTAAEQDKCERADKFGDEFVHGVYPSVFSVASYRRRVSQYRDSDETVLARPIAPAGLRFAYVDCENDFQARRARR